MVFWESSVLVTVPSDDLVTVLSVDLTVPSLLTVVFLSLEICRSQPTSRTDNARTDIPAQTTIIFFFIAARYALIWILTMG